MRMVALVPVQSGRGAFFPDLEITMRNGLLFRALALAACRASYIAALCLSVAACSAAPERPFSGSDPSDPKASVPLVTYHSTLSGYVSQRPIDPAPWYEQNERVAPAQKR
jgi:hypothetical protein